jgi:hypothetical protein
MLSSAPVNSWTATVKRPWMRHVSVDSHPEPHVSLTILGLWDTQPTDRAIPQAVSRWLPTAASPVRSEVRSCGICGGQSGSGAGFLRELRFPLPVLTPPTTPHSSSIIRGWYSTPDIGRRTKWTHNQSHHTPRNLKKKKTTQPATLSCCFQCRQATRDSRWNSSCTIPTWKLFIR